MPARRRRARERIMSFTDIPILSMLRTRMQWHQDRQRILADNVANADTPNFRPHDLVEPSFDTMATTAAAPILVRTDPGHQAGPEAATTFGRTEGGFEIRPAGNGVRQEDEMMKVASNQMDFQAVTMLYTKSLGLLKIAVGKR
jgi:flagellar basal-body rod protein FlgB